jgi:hypothetical protein
VCLAAPDDINQAATEGQQSRADVQVTFNAHGGTLPPSTPNPWWVWPGMSMGTLPIPFRAGFEFTGWWNGNHQVHAHTAIWHNMTLMASWRFEPARVLTMPEVMQLPNGWQTVPVTDLGSRQTFRIRWHRRNDHTDWSPVAPADVQIIQRILNPSGAHRDWTSRHSWSWTARPGIVTINGRRIAVGIHLFPHDIIMSGANPGHPLVHLQGAAARYPDGNWRVGGHMCMYYGHSPLTGETVATRNWERTMNAEAQVARTIG